MPCEEPLEAMQPVNGGALRFQRGAPRDGKAYKRIQIPCGTCILCREEQARQWAVRIAHEATRWPESSFITLTYSDENLPADNGLNYDDLQRFWKRLRKKIGKLRYYAVGEYGDKTLRPHYHACIFGHAFTEKRIIIRKTPTFLWTSPELEKAWALGQVSVGALTYETARYCAGYVTKKLISHQQYVRTDEQTGELIRLQQPRPFMSRNIAQAWWEEWNPGVRNHDWVIINGRKQKPPKAYDRWLGEVAREEMEKIKKERVERMERLTTAQTRARARNAHAHAQRARGTI